MLSNLLVKERSTLTKINKISYFPEGSKMQDWNNFFFSSGVAEPSQVTHFAWVKDQWWARPGWFSYPKPSCRTSHLLPPHSCLLSGLITEKLEMSIQARPITKTQLHHQCGRSPELFPQEWVWICTGQSLLHFLLWPKALTGRVQVLCGQRARSSQHILRRANLFSGSAITDSLIIYHCPTEHLQRHVLLSDLHVTCRITCPVVKTNITIITTWQMSK